MADELDRITNDLFGDGRFPNSELDPEDVTVVWRQLAREKPEIQRMGPELTRVMSGMRQPRNQDELERNLRQALAKVQNDASPANAELTRIKSHAAEEAARIEDPYQALDYLVYYRGLQPNDPIVQDFVRGLDAEGRAEAKDWFDDLKVELRTAAEAEAEAEQEALAEHLQAEYERASEQATAELQEYLENAGPDFDHAALAAFFSAGLETTGTMKGDLARFDRMVEETRRIEADTSLRQALTETSLDGLVVADLLEHGVRDNGPDLDLEYVLEGEKATSLTPGVSKEEADSIQKGVLDDLFGAGGEPELNEIQKAASRALDYEKELRLAEELGQ